MTDNQMQNARKKQQEIADILSFLKSKGYEFSEREIGRIEQMLIDGKMNTHNTSAVT